MSCASSIIPSPLRSPLAAWPGQQATTSTAQKTPSSRRKAECSLTHKSRSPSLKAPTDIAPRSGLASKFGLHVGAGVVNADYRGVVRILLFNHGDEDVFISSGDRVAQLVLERIVTPGIVEVSDPDYDSPHPSPNVLTLAVPFLSARSFSLVFKTFTFDKVSIPTLTHSATIDTPHLLSLTFPLHTPRQGQDERNNLIRSMVHPLVGLTIEVYHGNCLAAILGLGYVSSRCYCFLQSP
jgi:hypothetical protein